MRRRSLRYGALIPCIGDLAEVLVHKVRRSERSLALLHLRRSARYSERAPVTRSPSTWWVITSQRSVRRQWLCCRQVIRPRMTLRSVRELCYSQNAAVRDDTTHPGQSQRQGALGRATTFPYLWADQSLKQHEIFRTELHSGLTSRREYGLNVGFRERVHQAWWSSFGWTTSLLSRTTATVSAEPPL
ncbi:hypothetical protein OH77DRAFT_1244736 [Trametes cingulata]|nr:hypothetical protein OH77DRAFT_1244736 [Trametes cingulata]